MQSCHLVNLLYLGRVRIRDLLDFGVIINVVLLYSSTGVNPPADGSSTAGLAIASSVLEMSAIVVSVFPRPISYQENIS